MVVLRPLDAAGFRAFLERAITRRAERFIARGLWAGPAALEESRRGYAQAFPRGSETPGEYVRAIVGPSSGPPVGEVWYSVHLTGGKVRFMVNWIGVEPPYRRRGHAQEVLRLLEREAAEHGAEQIDLNVWADNPGAAALYAKLGYTVRMTLMSKPVAPITPRHLAKQP